MRFIGIALLTVVLACNVGTAAADNVPKLNVEPSCEAAAQGAVVAGRNKQACLDDERAAQEQVVKNWSQYRSADKQQCVELVNKGGPPSYVELLSCLEVMRDARSIALPELGAPLLEGGKFDVRKMDASVLRELGGAGDRPPVRARKQKTRTGVISQAQ